MQNVEILDDVYVLLYEDDDNVQLKLLPGEHLMNAHPQFQSTLRSGNYEDIQRKKQIHSN
jgi:hypothetical protein